MRCLSLSYVMSCQLDSLTEFSWRPKRHCTVIQHQLPPGAKPCRQYVHSQLLQQRWPWPSLDRGPTHTESACLQYYTPEDHVLETVRRAPGDLRRTNSAQRIPWTSEHTHSTSLYCVITVPPLILGIVLLDNWMA